MHRIRVMIVDDSAYMRQLIAGMLEKHKNIQVVARARNGMEALEKIEQEIIDVITMDIEMPGMNGLEVLERIMSTKQIPVVMLSSFIKNRASETIEALNLGAVDFITKPSNILDLSTKKLEAELVEKITVASGAKLVGGTAYRQPPRRPADETKAGSLPLKNIIAIGTSTGGPRALQQVIPVIPGNLDGAVLVVQHMPPGFTKSLAERLDSISRLRVKEAEDGETVKTGFCYIAPGDMHMRIFQKSEEGECIIKLDRGELVRGHRPSVDVLFESLTGVQIYSAVAVIMTGMGNDGARGIAKLKQKRGWPTIAQDEKSSVVFGMPASAIKLGAIDKVAALDDIGQEILKSLEVLSNGPKSVS